MRVKIDHEECSGHGRCYTVAPELFVDDERGIGQVIGTGTISDNLAELASRAVQSCPERAITLEDDAGTPAIP
jgi:ferredoxin